MKKPPKCRSQGFFMLFVSEGAPWPGLHQNTSRWHQNLILVSKWWKSHSAMINSQKAICCTFLFNYCTLICPVVQELPNLCNNWKSHCAWPFQLLHTHTLCLGKKLEWIFKNQLQKTDDDLDSPLISKMELFVTIINSFYQILIVSYKSIIDVAGALYLPQNR